MHTGIRIPLAVMTLGVLVLAGIGWYADGGAAEAPTHQRSAQHPSSGTRVADGATTTARVAAVIDGDTLRLQNGERVRLLGIDADETGTSCYSVAQRALAQQVADRRVTLVRDARNRDRYDRLLRYVFVDGEHVNTRLVRSGTVETALYPNVQRYRRQLLQAEADAREAGRGCEWEGSAAAPTASIAPCQAGQRRGQKVTVRGRVTDTHRDTNSGTVFLNFGDSYPDHCFTAVIFASQMHRFAAPARRYADTAVTITGEVEMYQGTPQIVLERPGQIQVRR